jgi:putative sigma-54 modulation protein
MKLEIHQKNMNIERSLYDHITDHIHTALARFASKINRVTIWLVDINGPRGGIDKQCRIAVQLLKGKTIRTDHTTIDLVAAAYSAIDRAAYIISQELKRRQSCSRKIKSQELEDE